MSGRSLGWVAVLIVGVGVALLAVHYAGSGTASAVAAASSSAEDLSLYASSPATASVPAPAASSSGEAPLTLAGEIQRARPMMIDSNGPLDRGTAALAQWASANLTWAELKALRPTSPALFRKDPDQERGRLLCVEGTIQEIRAEKNLARRQVNDRSPPFVEALNAPGSAAPGQPIDPNRPAATDAPRIPPAPSQDASEWQLPSKVFFATIAEPDHGRTEELRVRAKPLVVEAIAVRSSGNLVDGDSARFCGILTGVVQSTSEARLVHRAVGMFELPENTAASLRASAVLPVKAPAR